MVETIALCERIDAGSHGVAAGHGADQMIAVLTERRAVVCGRKARFVRQTSPPAPEARIPTDNAIG